MLELKNSARPADLAAQAGGAETKPVEGDKKNDAPGKKIWRTVFKLIALCLAAGVVAVAAYKIWQYFATTQETDDAYVTAHITPVSARIESNVEQILIDDNDHVKKVSSSSSSIRATLKDGWTRQRQSWNGYAVRRWWPNTRFQWPQ